MQAFLRTVILAPLCAATLAVSTPEVEQKVAIVEQKSAQTEHDDRKYKQDTRGENGCPEEMLYLARSFERALGTRSLDLIDNIFVDTGTVVTPHDKGLARVILPKFFSSLAWSTVSEESAFCEIDSDKMPSISVRYRHTMQMVGQVAKDSVVMAHLKFKRVEAKGNVLMISEAEIFENRFTKPAKDVQHRYDHSGKQSQCSTEAKDLARGYVKALGDRDVKALAGMFAGDGSYVLSTSQGQKQPGAFFGSFLPTLKDAYAIEEGIFCQVHGNGEPQLAVRFEFAYKEKDKFEGGVYFDQFKFKRESKHAPLKLVYSEMFENEEVTPYHHEKDAFYLDSGRGAHCSYEALNTARTFLKVLGDCDQAAVKHLFAPEAVVMSPKGKANARAFFTELLSSASNGRAVEEAIFCQSPVKVWPSVSVRFHYSYMVGGEEVSSEFFVHLGFGRRDKAQPLQILKCDLFKNDFCQVASHSGHNSYLSEYDNDLAYETRQDTKFLSDRKVDKPEGCTAEANSLVDSYYDALGKKDLEALLATLSPDAKVLSPHTGTRLAVEFYSSIFPLFWKITVKKEETFCELYEKFGTIAVRSYLGLDKKGGVIFTHFKFARAGRHEPLKLQAIEIFDNMFVNPIGEMPSPHLPIMDVVDVFQGDGDTSNKKNHVLDAFLGDGDTSNKKKHGVFCPADAYGLVDAYFAALANTDVKVMKTLFVRSGKVVTGTGVKNAKDFFGMFFPLLSNVKVNMKSVSCEAQKGGPPVVVVAFDYSYALGGMVAALKYTNEFKFIRPDTYLKLKIDSVEFKEDKRRHHQDKMQSGKE